MACHARQRGYDAARAAARGGKAMKPARTRWLLLAAWLCSALTLAHKPSDAYLTLERNGESLTGQWDIALRDLDNVLALDADGDGDITWAEVRARHADIAAYALTRLRVASAGQAC